MSTEPLRERRYVVELPGGAEEFDARQLRDFIRTGIVTPDTVIAADGGDWRPAHQHEELRRYLEMATAARSRATTSMTPAVSPKRLIIYLALAGLGAGAIMSFLAPICLLIGVFAKFVVSFAAFGAVLALGINSAVGEPNSRFINIGAGSFAAGGLVAWLMAGSGQFTPLHFSVIGLIGTAGLAWGLGLPLRNAIPVVATAVVVFPISILLLKTSLLPRNISGGLGLLLLLPALVFIPSLPFALFGGVLGGVIAATGEKAR